MYEYYARKTTSETGDNSEFTYIFRNRLFNKSHEVAVSEIEIPTEFQNVIEDEFIELESNDKSLIIQLPDGVYSDVTQLISTINNLIASSSDKLKYKYVSLPRLCYDAHMKYVYFHCGYILSDIQTVLALKFSVRLLRLLGFDPNINSLEFQKDQHLIRATESPDLQPDYEQIFILGDCLKEPLFVFERGDTKATHQYPTFLPIARDQVDRIKIKIINEQGDSLRFKPDQEIYLRLIFRPKREDYNVPKHVFEGGEAERLPA